MWTPNPFYYDFGRPFPQEEVQKLVFGCKKSIEILDNSVSPLVYEPGVGTGRILIPIAVKRPTWSFLGVERSVDMASVVDYKIVVNNVRNLNIVRDDVFAVCGDFEADLVIVSSLLHTMQNWHELIERILSAVLKKNGTIFLIGEQADVYDCALGRNNEARDQGLVKFWSVYREARKFFIGDDIEGSQVGARWTNKNEEVVEFLTASGMVEFESNSVEWEHVFRIKYLLKILQERCYSSMFKLPLLEMGKIISSVVSEGFPLDEEVKSQHIASVRCFRYR